MLEYLTAWDFFAVVFVIAFMIYGYFQNSTKGLVLSLILVPAMLVVCFISLVNLDSSFTEMILLMISPAWIIFALIPVKKMKWAFIISPLVSITTVYTVNTIQIGYLDPFWIIGIFFGLFYSFLADSLLGLLVYIIRISK
ncbi:MAG: hypothetical protein ACIAQZ_06005 [Sedimentisphaeraceae bacterium JB056]